MSNADNGTERVENCLSENAIDDLVGQFANMPVPEKIYELAEKLQCDLDNKYREQNSIKNTPVIGQEK